MPGRLFRAREGRDQKAVYWAHAGSDNDGDPQVSSPVEIDIMLLKQDMNALAANGETVHYDYKARVYTVLLEGSIVRIGQLAALPGTPDELLEVTKYGEHENIRGKNTYRWIELNRFQRVLPTVV